MDNIRPNGRRSLKAVSVKVLVLAYDLARWCCVAELALTPAICLLMSLSLLPCVCLGFILPFGKTFFVPLQLSPDFRLLFNIRHFCLGVGYILSAIGFIYLA